VNLVLAPSAIVSGYAPFARDFCRKPWKQGACHDGAHASRVAESKKMCRKNRRADSVGWAGAVEYEVRG
jgi:hypothetical protein